MSAQSHESHVADERITRKPYNSHSNEYEKARVVLSGAGILYGFSVYNSGAAQFIQIFDAATLPANGAVPDVVFAAAATASMGANWIPGRTFHSGVVICNSSTGPTLTIGAADCFFDAQYV